MTNFAKYLNEITADQYEKAADKVDGELKALKGLLNRHAQYFSVEGTMAAVHSMIKGTEPKVHPGE